MEVPEQSLLGGIVTCFSTFPYFCFLGLQLTDLSQCLWELFYSFHRSVTFFEVNEQYLLNTSLEFLLIYFLLI